MLTEASSVSFCSTDSCLSLPDQKADDQEQTASRPASWSSPLLSNVRSYLKLVSRHPPPSGKLGSQRRHQTQSSCRRRPRCHRGSGTDPTQLSAACWLSCFSHCELTAASSRREDGPTDRNNTLLLQTLCFLILILRLSSCIFLWTAVRKGTT